MVERRIKVILNRQCEVLCLGNSRTFTPLWNSNWLPEECTWTPWDRIQKFQQGSCLKGHRKISGQTYALFLGPGHVPLYLPPPLSPFFILYTRAHRPTHPHTLTPCFVPFPWSWGRFRWCWERDGDSSKKDISGHVKRLKEETANLHEASWHASWRILHALSPTLSKKTWDRKFKLPFFLRHTLFLFYRRSERRKEVRGSYADFHISRLPS